MATSNITFPIYNADGTPFNGLVLRNAAFDSVVMSLGDKITGDVYYRDNTLAVTMSEYIEYKRNEDSEAVKFVLVNPPTVVREGVVSDNSELRGMTKYSFVFYHPMYQLGNIPFTDVAVTSGEGKYLSENNTFSWIGYPDDLIAKLNKNLQSTQWIVEKSSRFPIEEDDKLSEVIPFDNAMISDVLKTFYDTWGVPYIIDNVGSEEPSYSSGKRFKIVFGLPSNEIYEDAAHEQAQVPFVFHYGQGLGLKNNSRTPRNNKIITRIAGYGSEKNIPYGYPQIIWYGDQRWDYTEYDGSVINYDSEGKVTNTPKSTAYPIYKGIVGGAYVKLIKHPFTRKNLMPKVYSESVFNKVSPYAEREIVPAPEYADTLTNELAFIDGIIAESSGNFKAIMQTLKATLVDVATHTSHYSVTINTANGEGAVHMDDRLIMNGYVQEIGGGREFEFEEIYNNTHEQPIQPNPNYNPNTRLVDFYDAIPSEEYQYPNPIVPSAPSYESHQFEDIKPELDADRNLGIISAIPLNADLTPADDWDDTMDDDGNYLQSYFQITLPQLTFDLYACASITEEMYINMRGGACIGCTFPVQVDWDDYKSNFFDNDGNFIPYGNQRNLEKYPDSSQQQISIIVQKDNNTFGTLMPNVYQNPAEGDTFVVLGISLPLSYIKDAEERLENESKAYMLENNVFYFDYPLKFDEHFLATHTYILEQIRPNSIIRFDYGGVEQQLFVKQLTVKYGNAPLPQYNITLTDNIEVVLNQIGQVADDVEKLSSLISVLRQSYSRNVWNELAKKLSKTQDDTAQGYIRFLKGLQVGSNFVPDILGEGGVLRMRDDGKVELVTDILYARVKAYFDTVEIREYKHTAGNRIASLAGVKCVRVVWFNSSGVEIEQTPSNLSSVAYFRCYFRASDGDDTVRNNFSIGDQAYCHVTSIATDSDNPEEKGLNQKHFWRLVIGRNTEGTLTEDGEAYIDLSNRATETIGGVSYEGYQSGSDVPQPQDDIIQLGNVNDVTRQGAIIEFVTGANAPTYQIFQGIGSDATNPYSLEDKNQIAFGYNSQTGHAYMDVFGDLFVGDRSKQHGYLMFNQQDRILELSGRLSVGSTLADGRDVNALGTAKANLLLNSSFTGDYDSEDVTANTDVTEDTVIYSDPLKHWDASNVTVITSVDSESGYAAKIVNGGTLAQDVSLQQGKWYVLSFRGNGGTFDYSVGGSTGTITLKQTVDFYSVPFVCETNSGLSFTATSQVVLMEIQLSEGNMPTAWTQNYTDGNKTMASVNEYKYVSDAIRNGNTDILGGLILSQLIKVGNYRDKVMTQETGGMSGIYTSDNSPFLWGGGTMSQAIYTIMKYANDPSYQASDEEVANMSNFVVTHGGRAILNDIILRGYVYALGGTFRGYINAEGGTFRGYINAESGNITGAVKIGEDGGRRVLVLDPHSISGQPNSPALYGKIQNETRFALSLLRELDSSFSEHANIKMNGYDGDDVITESEFSDDRFHVKYSVNNPDPSLLGCDFTFDINYDNGIVFIIKRINIDTAKEETITLKINYNGGLQLQFTDGDGHCLIPESPNGLEVGSIYHDNGTLKVVI